MKKFYYWLDEWGRNDKMRYIFLISFLSGYSVNKIDSFFQFPEPTVDHIDVDIVFVDPVR